MRYGRVVRGWLVLWDVDHTLLDAGGAGIALLRQAFTEMFGVEFPRTPQLAGRTDRAIAMEILTRSGLPDPPSQLAAFQGLVAGLAPQLGALIRGGGRVLPGAAEALAALDRLARGDDPPEPPARNRLHREHPPGAPPVAGLARAGDPVEPGRLVQSVLTGNMQATALVKLAALGLDRYLDLRVGAYGDAHEVRADLVPLARANAAAAYAADFGGDATVLVGDTPLDVEAARVNGARAVAVASGSFSVADLTAAGAHAVLPDLTDTAAVLAAIIPD
jgi:phosphoglycolate phosphatase